MHIPQAVLLCGQDQILTSTRAPIFRLAGFVVHTSATRDDAGQTLRTKTPDLLILCHTFSRADAVEFLTAAATFHDLVKLLLPSTRTSDLIAGADAFHQTGDGPATPVAEVQQLMAKEKKFLTNKFATYTGDGDHSARRL